MGGGYSGKRDYFLGVKEAHLLPVLVLLAVPGVGVSVGVPEVVSRVAPRD